MANVRIDQYPLKSNPVSADYVLIQDSEDLNVEGIRKYKKCLASAMPEVNNNVGSYTYSQLIALSEAEELTVGSRYLITNATAANFNLIVEAIAVDQIHAEAKDPLYCNDVIYYNFASDTITWRWDTVNDISAGEDWRNSNNISIGTGCSKIQIGSGSTVTIPNNCNNITIGNNCEVELVGVHNFITIGNNSTVNTSAASNNITIGDNCNITTTNSLVASVFGNLCSVSMSGAGGDINGCVFHVGVSAQFEDAVSNCIFFYGGDFTAATYIYNLGQTKTVYLGNDGARLAYFNESNVFVNVNAEA